MYTRFEGSIAHIERTDMLNLFIRIIQTALDELEVDLSEITDVEIEPHPGESYWLNFDNGKYYACVNQVYGERDTLC